MSSNPIIIFDSGVGGLSILREINSLTHSHSLIYLADQEGFPYGDQSSTWVKNRLTRVANWAATHSPSAFVLACNTATVSGVEHLRSILTCPVVAVEPVVKPLAQYRSPLLLATTTTLTSNHSQSLIQDSGRELVALCPKGLVQAVESMDLALARQYLLDLRPTLDQHNIDAVGLSCTHYPLIKNLFQEMYPNLIIVDPSASVAARLFSVIDSDSKEASTTFYTTSQPTLLTNQVKYYLNQNIQAKKVRI